MKHSKTRAITLFPAAVLILLAPALLAACQAGDGSTLDDSGLPPGFTSCTPSSTVGDSGNPDATSQWIQTNVWTAICTVCHAGPSAPLGVSWEQTEACNNVDRQSSEMASLDIIEPGDPDNSYMVWKLNGMGPLGEPIATGTGQMPLGGPYLNATTIENITDWISDGAVFD